MKTFLVSLACLALCGCANVSGTRAPDGTLTIKTSRFLWSSEGIAFGLTSQTNGTLTTTLAVQKSSPDSASLEAIARGAAQGVAQGIK